MVNKFPTDQSFQRLNNSPLDETMIFDTLVQAQDYANNNLTVYEGQIIHIKDARTNEEIINSIDAYESSCYINSNKKIIPICSLSNMAINILYDIIKDILNKKTGNTKEKLDYFYNLTINGKFPEGYPNYSYESGLADYRKEPWNPNAYTDGQIVLKMNNNEMLKDRIGGSNRLSIQGATYTIEDYFYTNQNEEIEFYKIITLDELPTRVSFSAGKNIEEVIRMCDTSKLITAENMFNGCSSLTKVDVSNWNVSNITNMSSMFAGCSLLKELNVSNWDVSNVTNMYYAFAATGLLDFEASNWDVSNVTLMGSMFGNCDGFTWLDFSTWDTSNVISTHQMFCGCDYLIRLVLDNWVLKESTETAGMFSDCVRLRDENIFMNNCDDITKAKLNYEIQRR